MDNLITSFTSSNFQTWLHDYRRNASETATALTLKDYIRMIVIIGGYCLLRPYLLRLGAKYQASDHERELDPNEMSSATAVSPKLLRGRVEVPEDSESDGEDAGVGTGINWGRKARRRQRLMIRKMLEAEEKRGRVENEAHEDADIEEFFVN